MNILTSQIQRIHALLPASIKNDKEQKKALIQQYTGDWNKTSTKDLTLDQANEIIVRFGGKPLKYNNWASFDSKNGQHRQILSLLYQADWTIELIKPGEYFPDLYRLSEFLKSDKSPVKKPLNKMEPKEVSKIIYALKKISKG